MTRTRRHSLLAGTGATLVLLVALFARAPAAPSAWLFAWFFFLGVPLGSMVLLCIHTLTAGRWGVPLRPVLTAASRTFPWFILLALPVFFTLDRLYPWLHPGGPNQASWYLNRPFLLLRLVLYFAAWWFLTRRVPLAGGRTAAAAVVAHTLLITFATTDLIMSLQPGWYSTGFGLVIGMAEVISALAFGILVLRWLAPAGEAPAFHDIGTLTFAFLLLWAYAAFSQFLIIWYENLPADAAWYLPRVGGVWGVIALLIVAFNLVLPFALLLLRSTKRHLPRLAAVAALLFVTRALDAYWVIVPSVRESISWLDPVALLAVGGLWFGAFLFHFERRLPARE